MFTLRLKASSYLDTLDLSFHVIPPHSGVIFLEPQVLPK